VGFAERGRHVAAVGGAAGLFDGEHESLVAGVEPFLGTQVEDLGRAVHDGGDHSVEAGQAAGGGGADPVAGVQQPGPLQLPEQHVVVDGDQHRGGHAAGVGEPAEGESVDQVHERGPGPVRGGCLQVGVPPDAGEMAG